MRSRYLQMNPEHASIEVIYAPDGVCEEFAWRRHLDDGDPVHFRADSHPFIPWWWIVKSWTLYKKTLREERRGTSRTSLPVFDNTRNSSLPVALHSSSCQGSIAGVGTHALMRCGCARSTLRKEWKEKSCFASGSHYHELMKVEERWLYSPAKCTRWWAGNEG